MSLATRCASCNTVFRVVQDQLKVSEGWVRCGRCDSVFNALEGLFDLGRDAPFPETGGADFAPTQMPVELADETRPRALLPSTEGTVASILPGDEEPTTEARASAEAEASAAREGEAFSDAVDAHLFGPRKRAESAPKPAGQVGARDRIDFSDARFDSDLFAENALIAHGEPAEASPSDTAAQPLESAMMRPDFLRRAERRARWQSGPARSALVAAALALAVVLVLQVAHHERDSIAAQWPSFRPALTAWCGLAGCTIEPLRRIDDVVVESTALARTPAGDAFVLSVSLRNRGALALRLPSIDLNLTDVNGRLVARRALAPKDFRVPDVLPAGAETALQLTLATATAVAGYTVEIFYP